jgi:nuclear receptor subfamily 1 group I
MASPSDSLQMIFKIMSSPADVVKFMSELAQSPHEANEVMKRFRGNQSDSLAGLNRVIMESISNDNHSSEMLNSILEAGSMDSSSSMASPLSMASPMSINSPSSFLNVRTPNSPQVVPFDYSPVSLSSDYDSNNNDYHQDTTKMLNEISDDIRMSSFPRASIDSIINEAIKLEYEAPDMANQMHSHSRNLNSVEIMKIHELLESNKALCAPVDEDMSSLIIGDCQIKAEPGVDPNLMRVINLTSIAIRRLIKMSKKISGFKKMCQEDQIALLKVII